MAKEAEKARVAVRRAQARLDQAEAQLEDAREVRRKSFQQAQAAGLSLAEIASLANLHRSRVDQILHGK
jgi:DNA-directed RNA polymerase specialized sigma24 family protein